MSRRSTTRAAARPALRAARKRRPAHRAPGCVERLREHRQRRLAPERALAGRRQGPSLRRWLSTAGAPQGRLLPRRCGVIDTRACRLASFSQASTAAYSCDSRITSAGRQCSMVSSSPGSASRREAPAKMLLDSDLSALLLAAPCSRIHIGRGPHRQGGRTRRTSLPSPGALGELLGRCDRDLVPGVTAGPDEGASGRKWLCSAAS